MAYQHSFAGFRILFPTSSSTVQKPQALQYTSEILSSNEADPHLECCGALGCDTYRVVKGQEAKGVRGRPAACPTSFAPTTTWPGKSYARYWGISLVQGIGMLLFQGFREGSLTGVLR